MIGLDKEEEKKHPFHKVKVLAEAGEQVGKFIDSFSKSAYEKKAPLRAPIDSSLQDVN